MRMSALGRKRTVDPILSHPTVRIQSNRPSQPKNPFKPLTVLRFSHPVSIDCYAQAILTPCLSVTGEEGPVQAGHDASIGWLVKERVPIKSLTPVESRFLGKFLSS